MKSRQFVMALLAGTQLAIVEIGFGCLGTSRAPDGYVPYATNPDLPVGVRKHLPKHAQDIYRAAFNNAFDRYGPDREAIAHRIAWAAVKRTYLHRGAGFWVLRSHAA